MNNCQVTKEEWIENHQDGLLKAYYDLCMMCITDASLIPEKMEYETALVKLGLLENDEEPEQEEELDYTNDAAHWDEWVADQRYDMYRDMALMGYEY